MNRVRQRVFLLFLLAVCSFPIVNAQKVAIKTNALYGATTTPNLGLEFGLGKRTTLDVMSGYNPFTFSNNKKLKHILVQPELRYWFCEVFNGHFIGLHGHGAQFNVGNMDVSVGRLEDLKGRRYEGYLYGGGLSYGYQWMLSNRWNLEASVGGGYARIHYDKYPCGTCGTKLAEGKYNYWGITRASLSIIYFLK